MSLNHEISASKVLDSTVDALATDPVELSVVMPCLNEQETVAICVRKAMGALRAAGIPGEVIVADSLRFEVVASTDRRIERVRVSAIESP